MADPQYLTNISATAQPQTGSNIRPLQNQPAPGRSNDAALRQFKIIHDTRSVSPELAESLTQLARMISNVTESYTSAIFLCCGGEEESAQSAAGKGSLLRVAAHHTLSREFIQEAQIPFGTGLVGWTAENGLRISVCPFEHDATTLLYYGTNQDLKSFIAVPILKGGTLFGVIACDSKKSYAYAKITEKILLDCALQAASTIELFARVNHLPEAVPQSEDALEQFSNFIRDAESEDELLMRAANFPGSLVRRDALVVVTSGNPALGDGLDGGRQVIKGRQPAFTASSSAATRAGAARFYTPALPSDRPGAAVIMAPIDPRLLELVYRHRRVSSNSRSVHALPVDDSKQRSFLSVPFMMLGREAGSINLLSPPKESFKAHQIAAVEKVASILGREIERIRLRDILPGYLDSTSVMSWRRFATEANIRLKEVRPGKLPLSLIRVAFTNIGEWESHSNIDEATEAFRSLIGLIEQVKRNSALSCYLYGEQALILTETNEAEPTIRRLRRVIERSGLASASADAEMGLPSGIKFSLKLSRAIISGFNSKVAHSPADGATIEDLVKNTALSVNLAAIEPQFLAEPNQYSTDRRGPSNRGLGDHGGPGSSPANKTDGTKNEIIGSKSAAKDREEMDVRKWALGTR